MAELASLIEVLMKQHKDQMEEQARQHREQMAVLGEHIKAQDLEMRKLVEAACDGPRGGFTPMASFQPFDSSSELWLDYLERFRTFLTANSVPKEKEAQVFLTNQSKVTYKLLSNLAAQQPTPKGINELGMEDIQKFMGEQYDPKRFVVRERYKFWADLKRRPGESIQELAGRIRHDAVTCDFQSIKDPLDEALRTRFICSVDNEAVLKALFKLRDDELTFAKAIQIALETEEAAKVAKETVYGQTSKSVYKVEQPKNRTSPPKTPASKAKDTPQGKQDQPLLKGACGRCGRKDHTGKNCPHINDICHYCQKKGHLQSVCMSKRKRDSGVRCLRRLDTIKTVRRSIPPLYQQVELRGHRVNFEIDSGANDTLCSKETWIEIGKPKLQPVEAQYRVADGSPLQVLGQFKAAARLDGEAEGVDLRVVVTRVPQLNLLGRQAMVDLGLTDLTRHFIQHIERPEKFSVGRLNSESPVGSLQKACKQLCQEFPDLFSQNWDASHRRRKIRKSDPAKIINYSLTHPLIININV